MPDPTPPQLGDPLPPNAVIALRAGVGVGGVVTDRGASQALIVSFEGMLATGEPATVTVLLPPPSAAPLAEQLLTTSALLSASGGENSGPDAAAPGSPS